MELNDFVANFAEQFEETDASTIKASTVFHELDEWSSLVGISILAMVKTQYGKSITSAELRSCITIEDVFNTVSNK